MISSIIAILLVASVYANTVPDYKSFTIGICRQDSLTLGVTTLLRTLDEWNQVHSDYATNCWFCPRGADCTGVVANGRRCSDSELLVTAENQLSCFSRATATGYNAPTVPNTVTVTTNPPIQTVPTVTVPTGTIPTVTVPTGTVPTVTIPTVTVPNTVTVTANGVPIRTNIGAGVPLGNGFVNYPYPFTNQPMVPAGCSCGSLTGATYGQALGVAGGLLYNGAIANGPLDARVINTPYGAGVVNGVYDARLLNGGLDTRFINAPYDARLLNGALDARLINTPYGAGVVNGVYDARLLNGGLDARVVNGPLDTQLFTPASYGYGLMNCAPYVPGTVARAIDTRFTTPYDTRFVNTPLNGALDARLINTPYTTQFVNTPLNGAGVVNGVYDARLLNGGLDSRLINTPYDGAQVIGSVRTTPYFGAAAWAPNMAGAWSGATVRTTPGLVNNIGDAYGNNVNVVRDTPRSTY